MSNTKQVDHEEFARRLDIEFPQLKNEFDEYSKGLLHCEVGALATLAEAAMDKERFWQAEKYFQLIADIRREATPEVENAIDVSFIEFFAFSELTENRYNGLKRMPDELRAILLEIDGRGRWA